MRKKGTPITVDFGYTTGRMVYGWVPHIKYTMSHQRVIQCESRADALKAVRQERTRFFILRGLNFEYDGSPIYFDDFKMDQNMVVWDQKLEIAFAVGLILAGVDIG